MGRNFYLQFDDCPHCGRCAENDRIHIGKALDGGGFILHGPNFNEIPFAYRERAGLVYVPHFVGADNRPLKSWDEWRAFLAWALNQPNSAIRDECREAISLEKFLGWVEAAHAHDKGPHVEEKPSILSSSPPGEWVDADGYNLRSGWFS